MGGHPVVWAPDYGQGMPQEEGPVEVRRVPMRGKQDWICRWRMGKAFASACPDGRVAGTVVLAEPGPLRWWMYGGLTRPPRPDRLVIILHGSEVARLTGLSHRRKLLGGLLDRADTVGVVSAMVQEKVLQTYPFLENRVVLVPGAVRSSWLDLPPQLEGRREKEILQVGRIHPRKGQLELVQAVARLPLELRSGLRIRCLGPEGRAGYGRQVRKVAQENGLDLCIEGTVSDQCLREAYERATLLVMPSKAHGNSVEGLGIALLEAQHFGCPVIGTRSGGIPEALRDYESGLLCDEGSAGLAGALARLLADGTLRDSMGRAGARFVRDSFSWKGNVRELGLV